MKHLFKIVLFNFLLFNSLLYGEVDNHTNYEAFEYGYNLEASKTLSSKDMSGNVKKCNLLNSDSEIFYCIVGVSEKSSKTELLSIDDMQRLNLEAYMQFVNERRTYVFNEDYRIKLQKETKINREKALLNKQISSSNLFFIGIHTENLSEHGLRFGYASSSKSIRYSAYYTQHTFKNKNQDLGATEIGVDLKIPFFNYKSYDIVPYVSVGAGQISVSKEGYENTNNLYLDFGGIYNINEYSELIVGIRAYDQISISRKYGSDLEYSSTGINLSVNYWF